MKKVVFSMLSLLFIFSLMLPQLSFAATGTSNIPLYLNGNLLNPEVSPQLVGSTTFVPIRIISEQLGAKVTWSPAESKVNIVKGQTVIQLWINKKDALVNGKSYPLEQAPLLIAGNTLVPVRLVVENLGIQVEWNEATRSVHILRSEVPTIPETKPVQPPPVATPEAANPNGYPELRSIVVTPGNQLQVQASGPVTPKIFYLSNPDRLVMDIPASTFSSSVPKPLPNTVVEIPTNSPLISKIRYAFNDPATATIRIVVELKGKAGYKLIENGWNGKVALDIAEAKYKVVLDAGHGSQDPGAKSITGKNEKDFNLAMALKVQALLQQNPSIQVTMTRSTDVFIPLSGRVTISENAGSDIFVSIHANSWMAASRGTETYYNRANSTSLAGVIHKHVAAATGFPNRGVKFGDFHVIRETSMPAVLLEVGYLSNAIEDAAMANEDFRNRVAASIAAGINEYLKVN